VLPDGAIVTDASASDAAGSDAAAVDSGARADSSTPPADAGSDAGTVSFPYCRLGCATAVDCTGASAAFDADNYECRSGACAYTGCNDDAECQSTFMSADYACRAVSGLRTCVQTCATASDCGRIAAAAFDADNYDCDAGRCLYTGCNDDAECASSFTDSRYVCRAVAPATGGLPVPSATRNCVLGCSVVSDCSTPSAAFDADNYECRSGSCQYVGCNADTECASSFSDARYVCR